MRRSARIDGLAALAVAACLVATLASCTERGAPASRAVGPQAEVVTANPVRWFEIPVSDLDRAVRFYSDVFGWRLRREVIDGYEMALIPGAEDAPGASGALAKGDVYVPSLEGPILYFGVDAIGPVLERARAAGAAVLLPEKAIGAHGFVAEFRDSEGNRIALHAPARR